MLQQIEYFPEKACSVAVVSQLHDKLFQENQDKTKKAHLLQQIDLFTDKSCSVAMVSQVQGKLFQENQKNTYESIWGFTFFHLLICQFRAPLLLNFLQILHSNSTVF